MTLVPLALLIVVVAGLPLAYALTRSLPMALVLSPLTAAATATAAVIPMTVVGGDLLVWLIPVYLLTTALAWRLFHRPPVPFGSWRTALLAGGPLLVPFLLLFRQPIGGDAHAIWWTHAGYLARGGAFTQEVMGNPTTVIAHPDYPPLHPAAIAIAWRVMDTNDFYVAQFISGAVTFSAIAMVIYAVRCVTSVAPGMLSWPAAIATGLAAWAPLWFIPTFGVSDAMCAAAFTAGAVLLLFGREPFDGRFLPLTLLLVGAAALIKNEGLSMALVLATVATVKHRGRRWGVLWCWLPAAAGAVWSLVARSLGAAPDVLAGARFDALLSGDPDTVRRFPTIVATMWAATHTILPYALVAAIAANLVLRQRRRAFGLGGDLWLWVVSAGYCSVLILIYWVTPFDVRWHLNTSVHRVLIPVVVMACASVACWAVVALASRPSGPTSALDEAASSEPAESAA